MTRKKAREIASFQMTDTAKPIFDEYRQRHVTKSKTDCHNAFIECFASPTPLKKMIMEYQPTLLESTNGTPTLETVKEPLEPLECLYGVTISNKHYCARLAPNFKEINNVELCRGCDHRKTAINATPTLDDPIAEINALNALQEEDRYSDHETALFDCHKLCRKFPRCTSRAVNGELGEIIADLCYVSKYPYQWTTQEGRTVRVCKLMVFAKGFPDDPKNPYPRCIAKQKDVPFQLPKDRIIREPEQCWTCYNRQKMARQKADLIEKNRRQDALYRGQPKVNWGKADGLPPFSDYR